MTTDNLLDIVRAAPPWATGVAAGLALLALILLARAIRKRGKGKAAKWATGAATVLGMAWSAQGMWDTAVNRYGQAVPVASVLFVVFECFLAGRMLRAHQYRADFARRGKFVTAVWIGACIMALVVALGEGWQQAPGRLAIPLLVAYGWYTDLTADDDPGEKPKTSWRLTPRRIGLAIGLLEPGERDAQTIDRDRLRTRMTRLAFRIEFGADPINDLLHRDVRLAKLKTIADDADLAEVRARLARMSVRLIEPKTTPAPPPAKDRPAEPAAAPAPDQPAGGRLPQGVHKRLGRTLRGPALEADAVAVMVKSIGPDRPRGYTWFELASLYDPPLGKRKAEEFAATGRRQASAVQINGERPKITVP
jgi:hypothetical protein